MSLEVKQELIYSPMKHAHTKKKGLLIFIILFLLILLVTIFHPAKLPSVIIFSYCKLYELPWAKLLLSQQTWSSGSTCAGTQAESKVLI